MSGVGRRRPRPWRAIAYVPDQTAPNGRRRLVAGRVAACTPDGLTRWINQQRDAGHVVDVIRVHTLEEATD